MSFGSAGNMDGGVVQSYRFGKQKLQAIVEFTEQPADTCRPGPDGPTTDDTSAFGTPP